MVRTLGNDRKDKPDTSGRMSFLRRVAGRSLEIGGLSGVGELRPLLLRIERSQLRWLGHLFRMPPAPGRLPREVFQACPTGRRPRGRPSTLEKLCLSAGLGSASGFPPEELEEVSGHKIYNTLHSRKSNDAKAAEHKLSGLSRRVITRALQN
ncbi:hypothetical protein L3Q82_012086, partial [Scortum barcoo]